MNFLKLFQALTAFEPCSKSKNTNSRKLRFFFLMHKIIKLPMKVSKACPLIWKFQAFFLDFFVTILFHSSMPCSQTRQTLEQYQMRDFF